MNPYDVMLWSVAAVVFLICLLLAVATLKGIARVLFWKEEPEDSGRLDRTEGPKQGFRQTKG